MILNAELATTSSARCVFLGHAATKLSVLIKIPFGYPADW